MYCILLIVHFDYSAKRDHVQAGAPSPNFPRAQTYSGSSKSMNELTYANAKRQLTGRAF